MDEARSESSSSTEATGAPASPGWAGAVASGTACAEQQSQGESGAAMGTIVIDISDSDEDIEFEGSGVEWVLDKKLGAAAGRRAGAASNGDAVQAGVGSQPAVELI